MRPARDYAVEVLRLFWQVFVPGGEPERSARFIRRYGGFCHKILVAGGLAEIEPGVLLARLRAAWFGMRPTAFLRAYAALAQQHSEPDSALAGLPKAWCRLHRGFRT